MDDQSNRVTFLYKLVAGICAKSFGMNVAHMAGVPQEIIDKATEMAEDFEHKHRLKDSTYAMDVDGQTKSFSPAVLADISDIFRGDVESKVLGRMIKSIKRSL